jgi:hypothetical protein
MKRPIVEIARGLRADRKRDPEFQRLWRALRMRQVRGLKWRCVAPVKDRILDFWCSTLRIGVHILRDDETCPLQSTQGDLVVSIRSSVIMGDDGGFPAFMEHLKAVIDRRRAVCSTLRGGSHLKPDGSQVTFYKPARRRMTQKEARRVAERGA